MCRPWRAPSLTVEAYKTPLLITGTSLQTCKQKDGLFIKNPAARSGTCLVVVLQSAGGFIAYVEAFIRDQ